MLIEAWRAKREIGLFQVVCACARCLCEVRSGRKYQSLDFPFSLFAPGAFPFSLALQGPIQLQLALSVHKVQYSTADLGEATATQP